MTPLHITQQDIRALEAAAGSNLYNAGKSWRGKGGIRIAKRTVRKLRVLGLIATIIGKHAVQERAHATHDGRTVLAIAERNAQPLLRRAIAG